MPTFANIDGEESGTVTFRVGTVEITRGTTAEQQEILCVGDPDSSNALAAVTNAAPASTRWGLNVRLVSGPSSVNDVALRAVLPSTAADNPVSAAQSGTWNIGTVTTVSSVSTGHVTVDTGSIRVHQSTAADLNVTVAGYSTTVNVSSVSGLVNVGPQSTAAPASNDTGVIVRQVGYSTIMAVSSLSGEVSVKPVAGSTFTVRALQSSAADLNVTVAGYSTTVNVSSLAGAVITRSSAADMLVGIGGPISTGLPTPSDTGVIVRVARPRLQSTTGLAISSAANQLVAAAGADARTYVHAYSILTTVVTASSVAFQSGSNDLWGLLLGNQSSGISGANLAVPAPGYLFATDTNAILNLAIPTTGVGYRWAITYSTGA